jgi:HlyD family type I secretion membrane fusion protein
VAKHAENPSVDYVLKHSSRKERSLKYDFMPPLLDIIERPAHVAGKVIVITIFLLLAAAIGWANFAQLDVVVQLGAQTATEDDIVPLQVYADGIIQDVYVSEGEYIEQGELLFTLDTRLLDQEIKWSSATKEILEAQRSVYTKLYEDADPEVIDLAEYADDAQTYLRSIIENERSWINQLTQLERQRDAASSELVSARALLAYLKETDNEELLYRQQEQVAKQLEWSVDIAQGNIASATQQHQADIANALAALTQQLAELESQDERLQYSQTLQEIRAPISGYYSNTELLSSGSMVQASQMLAAIMPADALIEFEGYLLNRDRADVEVGMPVVVKLEAYPSSDYGAITGTVAYISPVPFMHEQLGSVYKVRATIENTNNDVHLISGLAGSMEIRIGNRSMLSYFLEPITKGLDSSLKEK